MLRLAQEFDQKRLMEIINDLDTRGALADVAQLIGKIPSTYPPEDRPSDILWHYTSAAGIIGIIESKCLHATSLHCLNDNKEYEHALDIAGHLADQVLKRLPDDRFSETLSSRLSFISSQKNFPYYFSCCFTEKENDLSQWRGYANGEGGFAIGFKRQALLDWSGKNRAWWARCIYDNKTQWEIVQKLLNEMHSLHQHNEKFYTEKGFSPDEYTEAFIIRGLNDISGVLGMIKHPSFEAEKEYRILLPQPDKKDFHFRPKGQILAAYTKINLNIHDSIARLYVGPSAYKATNMRMLEALLYRHDLHNLQVQLTDIPYRSL
jgi:hypothetical protein